MDDRIPALVAGTALALVAAPFTPMNAVLGGAVAGYLLDGDLRTGTLTGAGAGALGSGVGGLVGSVLVYFFLSGLMTGAVTTAEWLQGLVTVAGVTAVAAAGAGAAFGALGGLAGTKVAGD